MIKKFCSIICIYLSTNIFAKNIIDLYGDNTKNSDEIIKRYGHAINVVESEFHHEILKYDGNKINNKLEKIIQKKIKLMETIQKKYSYLFVDFQMVNYPEIKDTYTTIEVIKHDEPNRLKFISTKNTSDQQNKTNSKPDLIDQMCHYSELGYSLVLNHKLGEQSSCPVYHCVWGFNHPKLKPYLTIFNTGAAREKKLIEDTLNKDTNPDRRAAAAFLVGYFKNAREIIKILLPHVTDNNDGVRNNVILVIIETMKKAKIDQIDVMPFLILLDSPYVTDRNKALAVLLQSASSNVSKKHIIQYGQDRLLALLKLKQPNNHEYAYFILKTISGKDFGENNLVAWKKWLVSNQK